MTWKAICPISFIKYRKLRTSANLRKKRNLHADLCEVIREMERASLTFLIFKNMQKHVSEYSLLETSFPKFLISITSVIIIFLSHSVCHEIFAFIYGFIYKSLDNVYLMTTSINNIKPPRGAGRLALRTGQHSSSVDIIGKTTGPTG